jgi:hypothetical protein
MPDLPRKVLLEAGLLLTTETAAESRPSAYWKSKKWYPRRYAQKAHEQDFIRHHVWRRDHAVCSRCGLNCGDLHQLLTWVKMATDRYQIGFDFHFVDFQRALGLDRCWRFPKALWDAHMIVPKAAGGNDHDLGNFLTLCLACHRRETNKTFYRKD